MTEERLDVVVIGAGVVGLAVARAFALRGRQVVVVERLDLPGQVTSSRNSGVIHSGIYYPTGSLKARTCVAGRERLYAYCAQHDIAFSRCGKLIVAQEAQVPALAELQRNGLANGVDDLVLLSGAEVKALEPEVRCAAGLLSPSTGIIDVHEYMTALEADLEAHGGTVVYGAAIETVEITAGGPVIAVRSGDQMDEIKCTTLVNSAGLEAVDLLARIRGYPPERLRKAWFAKGSYFTCGGLRPFRHLVYPMPERAGLGVHATLDLGGATRFGPDVEWITAVDYAVDPQRANAFYAAIREYWPGLPDGSLVPAYAGVRPKLVGAGAVAADFVVEDFAEHGVRGLINLLGIESPGLTASLALADEVVGRDAGA